MTMNERDYDPFIPCVKYQKTASLLEDGTDVIYIAEDSFPS